MADDAMGPAYAPAGACQTKPEQVSSDELELYLSVASAITVEYMDSPQTVETMDKLLDEKYLWPEDDEEDDWRWEEEEPPVMKRKSSSVIITSVMCCCRKRLLFSERL